MSDSKVFDMLTDFHLHTTSKNTVDLLSQITNILEQLAPHNIEQSYALLENTLSEDQALPLFKILCEKTHVDFQSLLIRCHEITNKHLTPRLLLHIICLPLPYVAEKLQIDLYRVDQLMKELHGTFTIENPIEWLKRLLEQILQHEKEYDKNKHDQLLGLTAINQPIDTAEERRVRERNLHPRLLDNPE